MTESREETESRKTSSSLGSMGRGVRDSGWRAWDIRDTDDDSS